MNRIHVIDSHTGGEPTRLIIDGGPDLGTGPLADRVERFREHHDDFRSAVLLEPRGGEHLVGGLLCPPHDPDCQVGVIFFNNRGYIKMCGHGTIGLIVTLQYLKRLEPGPVTIDTPVGQVVGQAIGRHRASVTNVVSFRLHRDVAVQVPRFGEVIGDVAWGGNWFFLTREMAEPLTMDRRAEWLEMTRAIRGALCEQGITGAEGAEIDHIELIGPPIDPQNHSRNFVLCPGGAYDRSPCGTGCSAKLACLAEDGQLAAGEVWRQESIVGSLFECTYRPAEKRGIIPTIEGDAFITGETTLLFDPQDPFRYGIPETGQAGVQTGIGVADR